eukprot:135188_1
MSTNEVSTKWSNLLACPITDYMIVPTGTDRNNYIVIDDAETTNCIYKYNINTNKWNKISGLNDSNINNYTHNTYISGASTTKSIILNDSLFIIGGHDNKSIFKWNVENKTLTKFS